MAAKKPEKCGLRKEVLELEHVIIEILKEVGVYQQVKEKIPSDAELTRLFAKDFEKLIEQVQK